MPLQPPPAGGPKTPLGKTKTTSKTGPAYTENQLAHLAARFDAATRNPLQTKVDVPQLRSKIGEAFAGYNNDQIQQIGQRSGLGPQSINALQSAAGQGGGASAVDMLGQGVGKVLQVANVPNQVVLGAISEGGKGALRGLSGAGDYTPVQAFSRGVLGQSKQQAVQTEKGLGLAATPLNLAGSVVTDPLSVLSFGTSAVGKEAAYRAADITGVAAEDILKRGAKAFTQDQLKQLETAGGRKLVRYVKGAPGGVKVAGRTVLNTKGTTDAIAEQYAQSGLARKVGDPIEGLFRNRALIIQAARRGEPGYAGVARQLETKAATLEGSVGAAKQKLAAEVQHALRIGEVGPRGDALARIRDSLDVGGANVALSPAEQQTRQELRRVYDEMLGEAQGRGLMVPRLGSGAAAAGDKVAETIRARPLTALIQKLKDPELVDPLAEKATQQSADLADQYTAHVLTPAGRELFDRNPRAFDRAGFSGPSGYAKHRAVEGSIAEKNARLAPEMEAAGLKGPAYEPDVRKAVITRGNAQIRDLAKRDYLQGLPEIRSADGSPVSLSEKAWKDAGSPKDHVAVQIPGDMGAPPTTMYFHKEVAPEIDRVMGVLSHRGPDNPALKAIDAVNQEWKKLAVGTPGFASRNLLQGNLFNGMFLGDVGSRMTLVDIKNAVKYQIALKRGLAAGDPYKFLSATERDAVEAAQRSGALGTGFMTSGADLTVKKGVKSRLRDETVKGGVRRVAARSNPLRTVRDVNTAFENNSRLALFLHNYKTLGEEGSAKIVRTRLFDYNDLTPFEQKALKRVSPFYTWSRKNIPLQLENLAKHPSRLSRIEQVRNEVNRQAGPIQNGPVPGYLAESAGVKVPFTGTEKVFKPDLPINSAADQLLPIIHAAGSLIGINALRGDEDFWRQASKVLTNNTGGVTGIPLAVVEGALGKNLFSGKTLPAGARVDSVFGKIDPRILNALEETFPTVARAKTLFPASASDKTSQQRRLISALLGVGLYPLNDQTKSSALYQRLSKLQEQARTTKDSGGLVLGVKDVPGYKTPKKSGTVSKGGGGAALLAHASGGK